MRWEIGAVVLSKTTKAICYKKEEKSRPVKEIRIPNGIFSSFDIIASVRHPKFSLVEVYVLSYAGSGNRAAREKKG